MVSRGVRGIRDSLRSRRSGSRRCARRSRSSRRCWTGEAVRLTRARATRSAKRRMHRSRSGGRGVMIRGGGGSCFASLPRRLRHHVSTSISAVRAGRRSKVALDEALARWPERVSPQGRYAGAGMSRRSGRDFGDIELIGGMVFVLIRTQPRGSRHLRPHDGADDGTRRHRAHGRLRRTLIGTRWNQLAAEIRRRRRDIGVTYYFCNFTPARRARAVRPRSDPRLT